MERYEIHPFANADDPFPDMILVRDEDKTLRGEEAERAFLDARLDVEMEVEASILNEAGNMVAIVGYHGRKGFIAKQLGLAVEASSAIREERTSYRIYSVRYE